MFNPSPSLQDKADRAARAMTPPRSVCSAERAKTFRIEDYSDAAPAAEEKQLELRIEFGRTRLTPDDAAALRAGSVLSFDGALDEPVDLWVDGRRIGRGVVVVVGNRLGVRVTELAEGQETPS